MTETVSKRKNTKLSLYPLAFEEAVRAVVHTPNPKSSKAGQPGKAKKRTAPRQ